MTDNLDRYLSELNEWLRIPSVSADSAHKGDIQNAAQWLSDHLGKVGATDMTIHPTKGHPIVTARLGNDPEKPTVLVYGHYDVQPSAPDDKWITPAFEPTMRDGKIYARGVADDKGQVFLHLKAAEEMGADAPCNIIFLIEGEEEVSSPNLGAFIAEKKDMLKCDAILISDTHMIGSDTPSIDVSLRGITYIEVSMTGANRDLHSGTYGGAVPNPLNVLSRVIAKLHDDNGQVTVPGFYDNVKTYSEEERKKINAIPFDLQEYKNAIGLNDIEGEAGYTTIELTGIRPCLDVNGMWGGYNGEGAKTIIPSQANAKISMRLVEGQDHEKAGDQLIEHIKSLTPANVNVSFIKHTSGPPAATSLTSDAYLAANEAFKTVWGKEPIPTYEGGSIPIVKGLTQTLGADVVLMGFGLNSDAIHSPNENFTIAHIPKGIATIKEFYGEFAKAKKPQPL